MEPRSAHLADSNLQPFLQPDFDPVAHLNSTLPSLSLSATNRTSSSAQYGRSVPLPELSTQLQALLAQLNAQATRLSNALTQLTDEIIRSGGRLAYEVEVLRGETLGLTDSLENGLRNDMNLFGATGSVIEGKDSHATGVEEDTAPPTADGEEQKKSTDPEFLDRLRTLAAVRSKLDLVIKVFGEAMQWPIAPSDLSLTSSLISISTPDAGEDGKSREERGKAFAEALRNEVTELTKADAHTSDSESAEARIADLRQLAEVWKGTAEEKARTKLVDSLQKLAEDRQRAMGKTGAARKAVPLVTRQGDLRYGNISTGQGGYGFLQNLRGLKPEIYLD